MGKIRILVLGAYSGIAHGLSKTWAADGHEFFLVGRRDSELQRVARDLSARGASVTETFVADLQESKATGEAIQASLKVLDQIDIVIVAYGILPVQSKDNVDESRAQRIIAINFTSVVTALITLSRILKKQGHGKIILLSSVAGLRGRASNYLYGSTKAALNAYASGMRADLHSVGIKVITVLPGFVRSAMTAHLPDSPLFIDSDKAGQLIRKRADQNRDVIYVPGFWRIIMTVIRLIPEAIFKRLSL